MTTRFVTCTAESEHPPCSSHHRVRHWLQEAMVLAAAAIGLLIFCAKPSATQPAAMSITSQASFAYGSGNRAGVSPISDETYTKLGMEKLAEMTAFARHNEDCPAVPPEWSAAFIVLLMTNSPSESQVEREEKKILALRREIGKQKWCLLYRVEMQEAYLIYRFITRQ